MVIQSETPIFQVFQDWKMVISGEELAIETEQVVICWRFS